MNGWSKRNTAISKHVYYFKVVAGAQLSSLLVITAMMIPESSLRLKWDICKIFLK